MTRAQAIGVLAIGLITAVGAIASFVSGVMAWLDVGFAGAFPALVIAPLVLGFVSYWSLRLAGPSLAAAPDPDRDARATFIRRALTRRSSRPRR